MYIYYNICCLVTNINKERLIKNGLVSNGSWINKKWLSVILKSTKSMITGQLIIWV